MRKKLFAWATAAFTLNNPVLYGLLYILFFVKAYISLDPDFGWHIMSGQYIFEHGVPHHDIYTYTAATFPWVHHEWLADLGNYIIYHFAGGYVTLAVIYAALWTLALWLVARNTRYRLLVLIGGATILEFTGVRTITWTALFFALMIRITENKKWNTWWLPPLVMWLWANMHGSFPLGILYLGWLWAKKPTRHTLLQGTLAVIASCITPYGVGMYVEIARTMLDPALHSRISEWRPFNASIGVGIIAGIWIGLAIIRKGPLWKRLADFEVLVIAMAVSGVRHTVPFVIYTISQLVLMIRTIPIKPALWRDTLARRAAIVVVILGWVLVGVLVRMAYNGYSLSREQSYPSVIAASLRQSPCQGNVFNHYNYGGYLIWRVPGEKVYIDGRMPSWVDGDVKYMDNYVKIIDDESYQKSQFTEYNVKCIVWDGDTPFVKRLLRQGWHVALKEANGVVLLKK